MSSQLIQFYRMLVYVSNESRFMIFVHFIMHFFFFLGSELTGGIGPGELTRSNWNTHTLTHTHALSLSHAHTRTHIKINCLQK